eukprot:CAMPEP_0172666700 /NCGR_PEP_ID=MMETSP1074-20121228/7971_1 /TAXON_ID=2916 /ORGANISM="Ceratium fusus, Strain PA161109" /LENGTH=316 /DNA_ID=CAMNT_0013483117 /DNA_START=210 /DNA_END=1160 /DNA_ORIENTATION=+
MGNKGVRKVPSVSMTHFAILPLVVFVILMALFAFGRREMRICAWILLAAVLATGGAILYGRGRWEGRATSLGLLCMGSALLGACLGLLDYHWNTIVWMEYSSGRVYTNVHPSADPGGYGDASQIAFSTQTFVDTTRSVGYRSDDLWCAAPILETSGVNFVAGHAEQVNFWAVGVNCCRTRASFECGPVYDKSTRSGMRIVDASLLREEKVPNYMTAVRQAAATFGFIVPANTIILRWTQNPDDNAAAYYDSALQMFGIAVVLYMLVDLMICLIIAYRSGMLRSLFNPNSQKDEEQEGGASSLLLASAMKPTDSNVA